MESRFRAGFLKRVWTRDLRNRREGQAFVEFAIIGMLLSSMAFGTIEVGRAYYASIAVTNAARDGARVAMDPDRSSSEIIAVAEGSAGSIELSSVQIGGSTTEGETRTVTATYDFTSNLPLVSQIWGGGTLEISHTASSRVGWE